MFATSQTGFVAIAAVGFAPIGAADRPRCVLPHTNRFQLGSVDKKGCFCPKPDAQWTVKNPGNGTANIDLGKYELQLDEKNSQIKIVNKNNGEVTNIWGDPHIDWNKDGKTDANFWGKTTFQLEDGTKITIDTEPFKNNPNEYVSSEVTVTRGDHAMKITGLSQNELGDLKVEYADRGGQALDWATTDGFVVRENACGEGWINNDTGKLEDGTKITIDTEPFKNNPNEYVSSEVTVTRGDHAMKITGLSQNELGDLKVEYADRGGQALDWATTDGFVVRENACGEGWINNDTGKLATQQDFNITKPGTYKPYEFTQQFGQALGLFLMTGWMSGGLSLFGGGSCWNTGESRTSEPPRNPYLKPLPATRGRVEQPDANTLAIHHRNGSVDTRSGGTLAWRANNPGLLPYNPITRGMGAIGAVDGVAVFANESSGRAALAKLMLGLLR